MRRIIIILVMGLLFAWTLPVNAATVVFEVTDLIFGFSGEAYSFVADQTPPVYNVTLTDFEFPIAFDFLGVAITTNSTDKVTELLAPGMTTFNVQLGETYIAHVLGFAGAPPLGVPPPGAGLFGLKITAVPIPPTLILLGAGIIGILGFRRRSKR